MIVEDEVCALIYLFLSNSKLVSCAIQVLLALIYKYRGYSQRYPKDSTGLYLTARFGLSSTLENILLNIEQERELILKQMDSDG